MDCGAFTLVIFLLRLRETFGAQLGNCPKYAEDIDFHHPLTNHVAPNPTGTWVSSRCEIVPKPRFIIRRFDIQDNQWTSRIYHYSDSWCATTPTFYVKIAGTYNVLPTTATPNSKASYGANFHFSHIYFNTDKVGVLETVLNFILGKCPDALPSIASMQTDSNINLDEYRNKDINLDVDALQKSKHCRYYFAVHPTAYRKIRMTGESVGSVTAGKHPKEYDKLYFAAIPPFHSSKDTSRVLMDFQYGLSRINRPGCDVCKTILKQADPGIFPALKAPKSRRNFSGEWVTEACLATDDKTFQTDFYSFAYSSDRNHGGRFDFHHNMFSDSDCKMKVFNMKSGGSFKNSRATGTPVKGVTEMSLTITRMSLTIFGETMLSLVRNNNCGDPKKWRIGVEQNLTSSNGCPVIGFLLPSSVKTLVRVSKTKTSQELYISTIEPDEKGTYFSSNLVACDAVTENFKARLTTIPPPVVTRVVPIDKDFKLDKDEKKSNSAYRLTSTSFVSSTVCSILYSIFYSV